MPPKQKSSEAKMLKRQMIKKTLSKRVSGISVKPKPRGKNCSNKSAEPESKQMKGKKPAQMLKQSTVQMGLKKLAARGKKSAMTSVKQRHLDQVIDDVGSGHICSNGQTQSGSVELIDGQAGTVTPVPSQEVSQSVTPSVLGNGNGGNVMALPRDIASIEVHASDNQDQLSDRWQNGGVLTSAEVGQGSILI